MINIHLVQDEKFINASINMFEKYYPGQNFYIVDKSEDEARMVMPRANVFFFPFHHGEWSKFIQNKVLIKSFQQINILTHFLTRNAAYRSLQLKVSNKNARLYWIFYGADLYSYLENLGKYTLYDYEVKGQKNRFKNIINLFLGRYSYVKKYCAELDCFCFWNYYDYNLLCKNVDTKAQFKLFYYVNTGTKMLYENESEKELSILVNHSASFTGNHLTIIDKLHSLSLQNVKLIFPLGYGPELHKNLIINKANSLFPGICTFLKEYMPIDTYYHIINKCQCAIMGHRRQEAGSNISFLLRNGKKVFLREDNSLLHYYRDLGCVIYSFEKDLNSLDDLKPLTKEQQEINRRIMLESVSQEKVDNMMLHLFD